MIILISRICTVLRLIAFAAVEQPMKNNKLRYYRHGRLARRFNAGNEFTTGSYRSSDFFPTVARISWDRFAGHIEVVRCPDKDEMVKIVLAEEGEEKRAGESHGASTALHGLFRDGSLTTHEWLLGLTVSRSSTTKTSTSQSPPSSSSSSSSVSSLSGLRLGTFLAGRIALRRAIFGQASIERRALGPILRSDTGAPALPPVYRGSISHKNRFAVAVAVTLIDPSQPISSSSSLGVDLEHCGHPDPSRATWRLLRRLLTETEMLHQRNSLQLSDGEDCDDDHANRPEQLSRDLEEDVLLRFSFKEAVFKALHPLLRRPISFQEVSVYPDLKNPTSSPPPPQGIMGDTGNGMTVVRSGSAMLHFHLTHGEMFDYSAQWWRLRWQEEEKGQVDYWLTAVHVDNMHRNSCD